MAPYAGVGGGMAQTFNVARHCDNRMCRRGRPKDADQHPEFFTAEVGGDHAYLGPCGCPCSQCVDAELSDEERLG